MIVGERMGTETAGFQTSLDLEDNLVHVRMWGLWSHDLVEPYPEAIASAVRNLNRNESALLLDLSACSPQRPDVQQALVMAWIGTRQFRLRARFVIVDNALTRLQVRRLLGEARLTDFTLMANEFEARATLRAEDRKRGLDGRR